MLSVNSGSSGSSNGKSGERVGWSNSIFRDKAVKHYLEGREQEVLPWFISPANFILLWIVFAALIGSVAVAAYFMQIPLYASGSAIVVDGDSAVRDSEVVTFLPPEHLESLDKGQDLLLQPDPESERVSLQITGVENKALSPREARERFNLRGAERSLIESPVAVATAPAGELTGGLDQSSYEGAIYQAEVQLGTRRVITLASPGGQ